MRRLGDYVVKRPISEEPAHFIAEAESVFGQPVILHAALLGRTAGDAGVRQRFRRDTQRLIELEHPGVIDMLDAGEADDWVYVALEPLKGVQLTSIARSSPLDLPSLVSIGIELADTLAHVHEANLVVGDLQPSNILMDTKGRAVISGLAMSVLSLARSGRSDLESIGRPGFVAPEVIDGAKPHPRSDQYALGRVLIYLATGNEIVPLARDEKVERQLERGLLVDWNRFPKGPEADELRRIAERMVARDPRERFEKTSDLVAELIRLSQRLPKSQRIVQGPVGRAERSSSILSRRALDDDPFPAFEVSDISSVPGASALDDDEFPILPDRSHRPHSDLVGDLEAEFSENEETRSDDPTAPTPAVPPARDRSMKEATAPIEAMEWAEVDRSDDPTQGMRVVELDPGALKQALLGKSATPRLEAEGAQRAERAKAHSRSEPQASWQELSEPPAEPITEQAKLVPEDPPEPPPPDADPKFGQTSTLPAAPPGRRRTTRGLSIAAAVGSTLLGVTIAVAVRFSSGPHLPEAEAILWVGTAPEAAFTYEGDGPAPATKVAMARELLSEARTHMASRNLAEAEKLLGLCIRMSDLPDCHRALASILALGERPGARAHVERYLETSPDPKEARRLRILLAK
jgi:serine/threonine protein kinase